MTASTLTPAQFALLKRIDRRGKTHMQNLELSDLDRDVLCSLYRDRYRLTPGVGALMARHRFGVLSLTPAGRTALAEAEEKS